MAHDHPLTFATLKDLKLPVVRGVPEPVFQLFETCEFGQCQRPQAATFR